MKVLPESDVSAWLAPLRCVFSQATREIALSCSTGGVLNSNRLNAQQVACYELAFASAELTAAETVLAQLSALCSPLQRRLALTWTAEAVDSIAGRLNTLALSVDFDLAGLQSCLAESTYCELRRSTLSGKALIETWQLLRENEEQIGEVPLTEELILAQQEFRRVSSELVAPRAAEIHRRNLTVPEEILQPMRSMGLFGLSIPERFGGSAPNDHEENSMMLVVTEALAEASLAAAGSLITRPEILSRALLTGGTVEQQAHWLPRIARGDPLCAVSITEPDYGSDVANLQLRATRSTAGWLINGAKAWCTFAGKAGVIMTLARTASDRSLGHRGLSILLVEKPSYDGHSFDFRQPGGGRLVGRAVETIGYRGLHSFDINFENFLVGAHNVVGGEAGLGKGFYFTMAGFTIGRLQTAARACGVMRAALRAAMRYSAERKVFGAPLDHYSLTAAKLVRMAARFVACRQLTYAVGRLLDEHRGGMEASLVKLFACRSSEMITREALQIHGAMGYAEETAVSRYFLDARVLSIFEGTEETLALKVVARALLENSLNVAVTAGADQ